MKAITITLVITICVVLLADRVQEIGERIPFCASLCLGWLGDTRGLDFFN